MVTTQWIRQPQEQQGNYFFSGQFLITRGVQEQLTPLEIKMIYLEIQELVLKNDGLDYLQVYQHKTTGEKLFFIDQLSKEMIESGNYSKTDNVCTLLLANEY